MVDIMYNPKEINIFKAMLLVIMPNNKLMQLSNKYIGNFAKASVNIYCNKFIVSIDCEK